MSLDQESTTPKIYFALENEKGLLDQLGVFVFPSAILLSLREEAENEEEFTGTFRFQGSLSGEQDNKFYDILGTLTAHSRIHVLAEYSRGADFFLGETWAKSVLMPQRLRRDFDFAGDNEGPLTGYRITDAPHLNSWTQKLASTANG